MEMQQDAVLGPELQANLTKDFRKRSNSMYTAAEVAQWSCGYREGDLR